MGKLSIFLVVIFLFASCNRDKEEELNTVSKADVINNYVDLVYQSYKDSYDKAVVMQKAINTFLDTPTASNFETAKKTWLDAREPYGQTEAYREASGPIDTKKTNNTPWGINNEGQMNAWPIDESYIDYVEASTGAFAGTYTSIIGNRALTINVDLIKSLNEKEDEKSISTGWHAIEFLLWGQDNTNPSEDKAGLRQFTDYTTLSNATRRKQYLKVATDILVADLKELVDTWNTGGTYRKVFLALEEDTALKQLIKGAFFIAGDELSSERMVAPVKSTEGINNSGQEDEHSCFSDNTHRDIFANAQGVINVIYGMYGDSIKGGKSFFDLVNQADKNQADKLKAAATEAMEKVNVIVNHKKSFDYLIIKESITDASPGPVIAAVRSLEELANQISASANAIGIKNLK